MAKDRIRKRGAVTDYRPDDDRLLGGKDHSVQTEAWGAEGSSNVSSSGNAPGRIDDLSRIPKPLRGRRK